MAFLRWIVIAVLFVSLLYLAILNSQPVTLDLFKLAKWDAPLVVVVFIAFACGVAAGLLAGALRAARLKRQVNKLRREMRGGTMPLPGGVAPGTSPASGPGFTRGEL